MVFRRVYWVVEEFHGAESRPKAVFTSLNDLLDRYLEPMNGSKPDGLRLSLAKLDSVDGPLGVWTSPTFDGLRNDLNEFIGTGECSIEEADRLAHRVAELYS